jgi:hypothetical protein
LATSDDFHPATSVYIRTARDSHARLVVRTQQVEVPIDN